MHDAAWKNDVDTIKLLFELVADPGILDGAYWAVHNQQREAANFRIADDPEAIAEHRSAPIRDRTFNGSDNRPKEVMLSRIILC